MGTGLNAPQSFDAAVCRKLSVLTGVAFIPDENKFHALTAKDALVFAHGALKALACNLMKIANDIRWEASGPRCGIGELNIPANEPGSSIMPGKVNPTQCEALTMVAVQVMGNDTAISVAASQGNFQLNVFLPCRRTTSCCPAICWQTPWIPSASTVWTASPPTRGRMEENLNNSLMLVTCLTPEIGYEEAAACAKKALQEGLTLREAVLARGSLSEEVYDRIVQPEKMVTPTK